MTSQSSHTFSSPLRAPAPSSQSPPRLPRRKGLARQHKPGQISRLRNNWLRVQSDKFVNMITFQEVSHRPEFCDEQDQKILADVCAICLCPIRPTDGSLELPCGHVYHSKCCTTWFCHQQTQENTCPTCRQNICTKDVQDHKLF